MPRGLLEEVVLAIEEACNSSLGLVSERVDLRAGSYGWDIRGAAGSGIERPGCG